MSGLPRRAISSVSSRSACLPEIDVSSPGAVNGREFSTKSKAYQTVKALIENGMSADVYAELCMKALEADRLHVFNDPEVRQSMIDRHVANLADFDACLADLRSIQDGEG